MKGHATLMSKASDEWATPQEFYDWANERYGPFDLDAAASAGNTKVAQSFFTKEDSALAKGASSWGLHTIAWLNPPYSQTRTFLAQAVLAVRAGAARVVVLVPARTDTQWWHETVPHCSEVLLLKGRLKFNEGSGSAPFPSALLVIEPHDGPPLIRNCDWRNER